MKKLILFTLPLVLTFLEIHCVHAASPAGVFRQAAPAVVLVYVETAPGKGRAGTGSIISKEGFVLTNAHVVQGAYQGKISIFLKPFRLTGRLGRDLSRRYRGTLMAADKSLDLALLKIVDPPGNLPVVGFGRSAKVRVGDPVYVIGHPEQGGLWSLTRGIISARWTDYGGIRGKDVFQTDAGINRGNSGGPLLDASGKMIGINAMIARKAADGLAITSINFAIQSDVALAWLGKTGLVHVSDSGLSSNKESNQAYPARDVTGIKKGQKEPLQVNTAPTGKGGQGSSAGDKGPAVKSGSGNKEQVAPKILTRLRPYRMGELERAISEMEDLMKEMRQVMEEYKNKKEK